MVGKVSAELAQRHEKLIERMKEQVFRKHSLADYRFESCDVIPPTNGFVYELVGGLDFRYRNKHGVLIEFSVKHETDSEFTIFISQPQARFTFGLRRVHFRHLDTVLLELSSKYWEAGGVRMGLDREGNT